MRSLLRPTGFAPTVLLSAVLVTLMALPGHGQVPTTATYRFWNVNRATGGDNPDLTIAQDAVRNLPSVILDADGVAGPVGALWAASQNPLPRLLRLHPSLQTSNLLEWRFVKEPELGGAPLGITLNTANGDVWVAIQGDPAFAVKLGHTDTFRKFRFGQGGLVSRGITVAFDGGLMAALPFISQRVGDGIAYVPKTPASGATTVTATLWPVGGSPRNIIRNGTYYYFAEQAANTIARFDATTGAVREWALPANLPAFTAPNGFSLDTDGDHIWFAIEGDLVLPRPSNPFDCRDEASGAFGVLEISTNTFTIYKRTIPGGLYFPQLLGLNEGGFVGLAEQGTDAVSIAAPEAVAPNMVLQRQVTPVDRVVTPTTFELTVTEMTVTPTLYSVAPEDIDLAGTCGSSGVQRFTLPTVPTSYPRGEDGRPIYQGHPQPFSVGVKPGGVGKVAIFTSGYFDGPVYGQYAAATIGRVTSPAGGSGEGLLEIECPDPMSIRVAEGVASFRVDYAPPLVAGGNGPVTVTCTPASGTEFPTGQTTTVTCTATDGFQTRVCSTSVSVLPPGAPDPNDPGNPGQGGEDPGAPADLQIVKTAAPTPVYAGGLLHYLLAVTNAGPNAAADVTVRDLLPAGTSLIALMPSQGSCNQTTVTCSLGSLTSGATATVGVLVLVTASDGTLVNTGEVSSPTPDPNPANNRSTAQTPVVRPPSGTPQVDLAIDKSDSPDPTTVGSQVTYTLVVRNLSTSPATNTVVTDVLPAGMAFVSAAATSGACGGTSVITCTLGTLPAGGTATVTIVVQATRAGVFTNSAVVFATEPDPTPQNNLDVEATTVGGDSGGGEPPIDLTGPNACLWPPNHKFEHGTIDIKVNETFFGGRPTLSVKVTSDEAPAPPVTGYGLFAGDAAVFRDAAGYITGVGVRVERNPSRPQLSDNGRVYTIEVTAVGPDGGPTATQTYVFDVPHDQRPDYRPPNRCAVDDRAAPINGPNYLVLDPADPLSNGLAGLFFQSDADLAIAASGPSGTHGPCCQTDNPPTTSVTSSTPFVSTIDSTGPLLPSTFTETFAATSTSTQSTGGSDSSRTTPSTPETPRANTSTPASTPAVTTTTTVTLRPSMVAAGATVTMTAKVLAKNRTAASGNVEFYVDGAPVGTAALTAARTAATAAFQYSASLAAGAHLVTARYVGPDARYAPSALSRAAKLTVRAAATSTSRSTSSSSSTRTSAPSGPATTTTTVSARPTAVRAGSPVLMTAKVIARNRGVPTGSVEFYVDGALIGVASLVGARTAATATFSYTGPLAVGAHSVQARYIGPDPGFSPSALSRIAKLMVR